MCEKIPRDSREHLFAKNQSFMFMVFVKIKTTSQKSLSLGGFSAKEVHTINAQNSLNTLESFYLFQFIITEIRFLK